MQQTTHNSVFYLYKFPIIFKFSSFVIKLNICYFYYIYDYPMKIFEVIESMNKTDEGAY